MMVSYVWFVYFYYKTWPTSSSYDIHLRRWLPHCRVHQIRPLRTRVVHTRFRQTRF